MSARRPIADIAQVAGLRHVLAMRGAADCFNATVRNGRSTAIQVIGDSTGNGLDEWVYLLGQALAAAHPTYGVRHRLWNGATEAYDAPATIQASPSGVRGAVLDASASSMLAVPTSAVNSITGDIDVRFHGIQGAHTVSVAMVSKYGSAGNRGWRFLISSQGLLNLNWSTDGTNQVNVFSTAYLPFDTPFWGRATLAVATGQVLFYTSADGLTWSAFGGVPAAVGATSIYASTADLCVGGRSGGGDLLPGTVYEVDVRGGINGPSCVPLLPDAWTAQSAAVAFTGSPVIDIINGSFPGGGLWYHDASDARRTAMLPFYGQSLAFVSMSHNDNATLAFEAKFGTYITSLMARLLDASVVVTAQNPKTAPVGPGFIANHADRMAGLQAWAAFNDCGFVDVFRAFTESGAALSSLVNPADGIHPLAAGSRIWADTVYDAMTA